ncbi:MAG: ornithine carbamoyltransferase [Candidatus Omnitrophota bacterium]
MQKDLTSIKNLTTKDIQGFLDLAKNIKSNPKKYSTKLFGKTLGLIFEKPSNRTRVSFEVGMFQLGGTTIYLDSQHIQIGKRETTHDIALTLSRYLSGIVVRTFSQSTIEELAKFATIPVINGLSDFSHPCQALADIFTVKEKFKKFQGITLSYVGDGNNVCNSLMFACSKVGLNIRIACPEGFCPDKLVLRDAKAQALKNKCEVVLLDDPRDAIKDADIIYTDVWTSMGQEEETERRKIAFRDFQVNSKLISYAKPKCLIMHCLPAHRGEEITDEVIDSSNSVVFDQAENRLHIQKAILLSLLSAKNRRD